MYLVDIKHDAELTYMWSSGTVVIDHVNMTLSIRSSQTGVDFLNTSLTFYDCSAHRS